LNCQDLSRIPKSLKVLNVVALLFEFMQFVFLLGIGPDIPPSNLRVTYRSYFELSISWESITGLIDCWATGNQGDGKVICFDVRFRDASSEFILQDQRSGTRWDWCG